MNSKKMCLLLTCSLLSLSTFGRVEASYGATIVDDLVIPQAKGENLPWCDNSLIAEPIDSSKLKPAPEIKQGSEPIASCKLKAMGHELSAEEIEIAKQQWKALAPDDFKPPAQLQPSPQSKGNYSRINAPLSRNQLQQGTWTYTFAINKMACYNPGGTCSATSPGVNAVQGNFSTNLPTAINGGNWSYLHFYNRIAVGHPSYTACTGWSNFSLGYNYGNQAGYSYSHRIVVNIHGYNYANAQNVCAVFDTGISIGNGPGNFSFYASSDGIGTWTAWIWLGQWVQVTSWRPGYQYAAYFDTGAQMGVTSPGSFSQISVPVNMVNKVRVTGTGTNWSAPWVDGIYGNGGVGSALNGRTIQQYSSPWVVMDGRVSNYTSVAFHVNP